ncbi:uncharacterized protein LOC144376712 [Ictidomys tridecemlineatus]
MLRRTRQEDCLSLEVKVQPGQGTGHPTPFRSCIPGVKTPKGLRELLLLPRAPVRATAGKGALRAPHWPKTLPAPKPREPAQSLEAPPTRWAPRPRTVRSEPRRPRRDACLGRAPTGGDGPTRRPAPREGPIRRAAAAHLRVRPRPARRCRRGERASTSPRGDSVRRRPQPLTPGACFQIASSSRGRVSFRRPEIRDPPPPRRAHVTPARSRAQPRRRGQERRPRPRGRGPRRKLLARPGWERVESGTWGQSWAVSPDRNFPNLRLPGFGPGCS